MDNKECLVNGAKEIYSGLLNKQKEKHGFGILKMDNNDVYKGEFIRNEFYGIGSLDLAVNSENTSNHKSGDKYFGEWEGGKVHGFGV